jgi:hypothetical protein
MGRPLSRQLNRSGELGKALDAATAAVCGPGCPAPRSMRRADFSCGLVRKLLWNVYAVLPRHAETLDLSPV